jgi:hypothetical protein
MDFFHFIYFLNRKFVGFSLVLETYWKPVVIRVNKTLYSFEFNRLVYSLFFLVKLEPDLFCNLCNAGRGPATRRHPTGCCSQRRGWCVPVGHSLKPRIFWLSTKKNFNEINLFPIITIESSLFLGGGFNLSNSPVLVLDVLPLLSTVDLNKIK